MIDEIGTLRELTRQYYRPTPCLMETWQEEVINASIWGIDTVATGAVAFSAAEPPYLKVVLTGPANGDTARLYSQHRWFCNPQIAAANYLKNSIYQVLNLEWEMKMATVDSALTTAFFIGWGDAQNVTEGSNNIMGVALDDSNRLLGLCNDGTGPTYGATYLLDAAGLVSWHKLKIEVKPDEARYYLDGEYFWSIVDDHPNTANYINFYLPQEAGANSAELHIANIRVWAEDHLR